MAGLPKGYYTLGDGHIHKIPTTGYSKWYKRGSRKFRYDNANKELVVYMNGEDGLEEMDRIGLSFTNWIENPDYWIDNYNDDLDSMISDFDVSEFL